MRRAAALLLAIACGAPPAPPAGALSTGADLLRLKQSGAGGDEVVLAGQPLKYFSPPFAPATTTSAANAFTVFPGFSEGQPAAYLTTETWKEFPRVWIQPLYVPITAWSTGGPVFFPAGTATESVFSVDAGSRFYSPYWQIFYFVTDQPAGVYRSAKAILDAGLELHEGPGKFCAIVPEEMLAASNLQPLAADPAPAIGVPAAGYAWVDGHSVFFLDLGLNRFTWNGETNVVNETAQFEFATADGTPVDLPKVGGTGPLHAPRPAPAGVRPQFGALWHRYSVLLPRTAAAFVLQSQPSLAAYYAAQGVATFTSAAIEAQARPADYLLRVALNPAACAAKPAACSWLDSQLAIEQQVPDWRIVDTHGLASCPLLLFAGKAIGL